MMAKFLRFSPLIIFVVLGLFFLKGLSLNAKEVPSVMIGQTVPVMTLPRLEDDVLQSSEALKGRVLILNVWSSWCEVCAEEQDFLMALSKQGVPIYGLNYKDHPRDARAWLRHWGDPYQWSLSDEQGRLALDLGVYGAPETFLIDANGVIRYRHTGALTPAVWETMQRAL